MLSIYTADHGSTLWSIPHTRVDGPVPHPSFIWDQERRFRLRCEPDALYFHLYGVGREGVDYTVETFPIVKRKDEAAYGEYRTKRVLLEMWERLTENRQ